MCNARVDAPWPYWIRQVASGSTRLTNIDQLDLVAEPGTQCARSGSET